MATVRGDDEMLELLELMGGGVGGNAAAGIDASRDTSGLSVEKTSRKVAQRPQPPSPAEAAGEVAFVPETGWNGSIWNPHVFEPAPAAAASAGREGKGTMRIVSPQEEVLRQQAVASVFSRFQVLGKELGVRTKNEMFERWQFSRKLKEGRGGDPILPAESFFDPGLDAELQGLGVDKSQSRNLCCELGRASKSALKTLKKQLRSTLNGRAAVAEAAQPSKRVVAKRLDESTYVLQLGKNRLRLNSAHYDKMQELFRRARVQGTTSTLSPSSSLSSPPAKPSPPAAWIGEFHDCLFACLMRYEALQGGGFQASMGGDVFDVLLKRFGARMECFASPFNCRYSRYCSAFADTDGPFGSVGSFFDFHPTEGAYEANPPFVRDVILKMAKHMDSLLKAATKALTFVVIIPCWEDSAGWQRLRDSAFLSKHIKLDQKDHGYCEGKQHLRRNRYRQASFHTSVFFLQTEAARRQQAPGTLPQACEELERAFALRGEADGSGDVGGGGGGGENGPSEPEMQVNGGGDTVGDWEHQEEGGGDGGGINAVEVGIRSPSGDDNGRERERREKSPTRGGNAVTKAVDNKGGRWEGKETTPSAGNEGSASGGAVFGAAAASASAAVAGKAEKMEKRAKRKRRRRDDGETGGVARHAGGGKVGKSKGQFGEDGNAAAGSGGGGCSREWEEAKGQVSSTVGNQKRKVASAAVVAAAEGMTSKATRDVRTGDGGTGPGSIRKKTKRKGSDAAREGSATKEKKVESRVQ